MKIPSVRRSHGVSFNLTPLIDIVFLLVIFFLVASHFVRDENLEPVELPSATAADDAEQSPHRVVLTITVDGEMTVAGLTVGLPQLREILRAGRADAPAGKLELRVRADRNVPYRVLEPVLLIAAQTGIRQVRFNVVPG